MSHGTQQTHGFSLIELLMSMALVAVLLTIASPSFANLIGRTRSQSACVALDTALNLARISAITRGVHVVACPSADQQQCQHTTEWHHGWLVFADIDHDGARSANEPLIGVMQAQPSGVGIQSTTGRLHVDYQPDGSAGGTNLTLTLCDRAAGASNASTLVVNQNGRIRRGVATADAATACLAIAG